MMSSIVKPLADKKQYRYVVLNNGVRILLISEPMPGGAFYSMDVDGSESSTEASEDEDEHQCRLAAASLCVNVGSFSDPENFQGLAHFLEHMLFLGSEKYPSENYLDDFLKAHSGHTNACTEGEHTLYYFSVSQDGLYEALDIFASCLSKPLLLQNAVDREVKAVQSEYEDNLLEDSSRRLQLLAMMAKHGHPFSGFSFGNAKSLLEIPESLGLDINAELRSFFQKNYSSDRMYIAIQSHHPLDTMQSWIETIFGSITRPTQSSPTIPQEWTFPFSDEKFCRLYKICPARDMHELIITWALPSMLDKYTQKPHHYLSFIIGDESPGGLVSFLRKKRLALQLVAGSDESCDEHNQYWCKFSLNIQLTDDGLAAYELVIRYVFFYLAMLRETGPQKRIFEELKHINQFRFDYQDESEAVENVNNLCQYLKLYPVEHVLNGSFVFTEWNPELVTQCLVMMDPNKCNIMLSSKFFESELENAETEKWFHTKYKSQPLNPRWWENITASDWEMFSIPSPNTFIPRDFDIVNVQDGAVTSIPIKDEDCAARLWFKPGALQFAQPKMCVSLLLFGDVFCNSHRNRTAVDIYLALLQLYLIEKLYPASVAGLKCSIKLQEFSKFGINIRFSGFSDKLPALIELVLTEIVNFDFSEDMFNIISGEIERDCKNSCVSPMDFGHQIRLSTLLNDYYAKFQRMTPHSSNCYFSIGDFRAFLKDWRESRSCILDCFISGNVDEDGAKSIFLRCKSILEPYLCSSSEAITKELKLTQKSQCAKIPSVDAVNSQTPVICVQRFSVEDDKNFAVISYHQMGIANFRNFCLAQLYEMIVSEPCFNILRTQKQLGYNCFLEMHDTAGTLGFSVTIQSSHTEFSPKSIDDEVDMFLKYVVEYIKSLSLNDYEDQVSALIELKLTPFSSVKSEARYYWSEICNRGARMFDRRDKEAELLATISQEEITEFAQRLVTCRQKLLIQVIHPAEAMETYSSSNSPIIPWHLMLCKPKSYENGLHERFVHDFSGFKQSLAYNPHVEF